MYRVILLLLFLITTTLLVAQTDTTTFKKTGFSFGALPAIAYDSDLGFQYGALANMYWYGNDYPNYHHSLYLECSRYTAGTSLFRAYFDSRKLIPHTRFTADLTSITDLTCDFTGFNGRETRYNANYTDRNSNQYITSIFYAHKRNMLRAMFNVKQPIRDGKLFWQLGTNIYKIRIGSVERSKLRHSVPDIENVYDKYVAWHIIKPSEADGGTDTYLRAGLGIDNRDAEAFPTHGIWTEVLLAIAPQQFSSDHNQYGRLTIYHRQYFSLIEQRTVITYRIGWQHKLWGNIPFYLLPHWNTSVLGAATSQGLGGSKTMRGVVRNRIVGNGSLLANIELRHIWGHLYIKKQDFSIGTNLFTDLGMVTQKYKVDLSEVPTDEYDTYFTGKTEKLHQSVGIGLKIAMNSNFVISADWGKALSSNDGTSGLYVTMNYLF